MDSSISINKPSSSSKQRQMPKTKSISNKKILKKKRKRLSEMSDNLAESKKKKKLSINKSEIFQQNKNNSTDNAETHKNSSKSKDIKNSNKTKAAKMNINKKIKKNNDNCQESKSLIPIETKSILKTKKKKKPLKNSIKTKVSQLDKSVISKATSLNKEKAAKLKKNVKKLKKSETEDSDNWEEEDECLYYCTSDDNESDDEDLRKDIQNSSIFKDLQKFLKKTPDLNPIISSLEPVDDSVNEYSEDDSLESNARMEESDENDDDGDSFKEEIEEGSSSENSDSETLHLDSKPVKNKQPIEKCENIDSKNSSNVQLLSRNANKNKNSDISSNLRNKVREKLASAKFRFLNEKLYTETGKEAFKYFTENKEEFDDYHLGYRLQVSKWPMNPVNEIISDIQKLNKKMVIADLGCGDAKIAQTFPDRTVHSFDLVPLNEYVKSCDISKVSLQNESVDVVVFCLSLMGVNLKDYLCEAFRILKVDGILKIAEVESRIEDLNHFIKYLTSIGFTLLKKNTKHKMFVFLELKKQKAKCKSGKIPSLSLRPCLYKKR
ncbi:ribosomal RNA-processing protein 8 [Caerostris darwini]|uniref:Ribosomal RNA-processing protein 8 n=1 Tax=Caerostris darwini TaxID=1538125 RepID=A0AAV4ULY3_9ARAC|nr:ribosomal RNA-processing protein 8 [Caerostris darwini]